MARVAVLCATLSLFAACRASAQTAVHGWIDVYDALNSSHPRFNFFEGIGTSAHRADNLALNAAALELVRDPKPLGFHIVLDAGDSADVVHAAEPHWHRAIYQASASYAVRGVTLEAGVYPSHIGFEAFFSKDNWNYTRGWLGELSPYYQSGVKASYGRGAWSGQLHLLRGWQNVSDANAPKAVGTQIAYAGPRLQTAFNTYADEHRKFGDWVATLTVRPSLTLGASIDRGREAPANWLGLAAYARYALGERRAIAARAERFRDPRAGISGFSQTLTEGTLTFETRPSKKLIVKFEARRDHSTAAVFNGSTKQTLAIASAVAVF